MSEVLSTFILLTEIVMVLQCLQIAFRQELRCDRYMVGIISIDIIVYLLINLNRIPAVSALLLYGLLFLYCRLLFRKTVKKTIVGMIIGLSLAGCIEVTVFCITNLFKNDTNSKLVLFLSSLVALSLSYIMRKNIQIIEIKGVSYSNDRMFGIALFYGLALSGLVLDYYLNRSLINIYAVFILVFIVFMFFYIYRLEQTRNEIEKKNYELELQKVYGGTYEKLLAEVRRKQHDFKNQLGAIYSMHLVAQSLEELVNMQKEYGVNLQLDSKFDSILMCCDNSILAGYLYYRCITCENEGIMVDYNIHINQAACCFELHEIIEILGILIDNACEYLDSGGNVEKRIGLNFLESDEKIEIAVSNPARYITFSQIEKMFVCGYSSKGNGRGIGLARVLELVKKYSAEIKVYNFLCNEQNWINFSVVVSK